VPLYFQHSTSTVNPKASGADTLVMGAFGESRLAALLGLGRTTAKVVTSCPVPLLIQA
jgi:nucleotide-binding universal stress UspA family protein